MWLGFINKVVYNIITTHGQMQFLHMGMCNTYNMQYLHTDKVSFTHDGMLFLRVQMRFLHIDRV